VVQMAQENRSWGYDRLARALAHMGYAISDQTVGNILKRRDILPAPERKKTTLWKECIRSHMDVLWATDFFTTEVWTMGGLVTYYVLCFLRLGTREGHGAGGTPHPTPAWMMPVARYVTMEAWGFLSSGQDLIHDRDGKYCPAFQHIAVGAFSEEGVAVAAAPVWGSVALACAPRVWGTLSSRAASSGQGECPALSCVQGRRQASRPNARSGTAGRAAEILRVRGRMSFLTKRKSAVDHPWFRMSLRFSCTRGRPHRYRVSDKALKVCKHEIRGQLGRSLKTLSARWGYTTRCSHVWVSPVSRSMHHPSLERMATVAAPPQVIKPGHRRGIT
jgi:hypothetical protein